MKKIFISLISIISYTLAAEQNPLQENPQVNQPAQSLVRYTGPTAILASISGIFRDNSSNQQKFDINDARTKLNQSTADLKAIGESAQIEYDSIKEECEKLDSEQDKIPTGFSVPTGNVILNSGILTPFFNGHITMVNLPKDPVDRFEHRRWAENLSGSNAGNARLNIESYGSANLADTLHISARHCSNHSDPAGHHYTGANSCCQFYTRGLRQELIAFAAFASRHSRGHDAYVEEFNRFENQVSLLYNHHATLVNMYKGIFLSQAYPAKPVNNYTSFRFRDWLIQLASSNNTPAILALTDLDDPGTMAEKIYVSCRHGNCGHGTGTQYTGWNWCGNHHVRAIRVELFELARNLVVNQRNHDNYVQGAIQFESAAKAIINNYWTALQSWNGLPMAVGNVVINTQPHSLINPGYQDVRNNRDRLRSHLTKAIKVLGSAARCKDIANNISTTGEKLCSEVESYNASKSQQEIKTGVMEGFTQLATGDLQTKVLDLDNQNKQLLTQILNLETKNKELSQKVQDNDWKEREKVLEDKYNRMLEERMTQDQGRDKRELANFLGLMLYELNGEKDDNDLDIFTKFNTFQDIIERARIKVLKPVEKLIANSKKAN